MNASKKNMTAALTALAILASEPAGAWQSGAPRIYAADGTYLGTLSANPYDADSISNPYGQYGSPYAINGINNPYSMYGSPYSLMSPNNPYALPSYGYSQGWSGRDRMGGMRWSAQ